MTHSGFCATAEAVLSSNRGMTPTPHAPDADTEQRLTELEIKASYADDLLDTLNQLVARQQEQIDLLLREVGRLRQQGDPQAAPAVRNLRDELPPHY
jgi:SlyX protein